MAKSRFEYVKSYELPDILIPNTYLIVRVDGHAFHKYVSPSLSFCDRRRCTHAALRPIRFSDNHRFTKPNDERALVLMDRAARSVMEQMPDVVMAFGESDEYRLVFDS